MQLPEIMEEFSKSLEDVLSEEHQHHSAFEKWNRPRVAIQKTALATFREKTSKNRLDVKSSEMTPAITTKCAALVKYKCSPSRKFLQALRAARSKVQ